MKNELFVAYATDSNYVFITGISLYSLLENNKSFDNITVYILDNGITANDKFELSAIAEQYSRNLFFLDCSSIGEWLGSEVIEMFRKEKTNVPIASYARLFLPDIIESDINRILYLDSDTLVLSDLHELWNYPMGSNAIMGVRDNVGLDSRIAVGLSGESNYINAGMLVLDLFRLRNRNFTKQMLIFIKEKNGHVCHHDQGVINAVLSDSIGVLPPKFNVMSFVYEHRSAKKIMRAYELAEYYIQSEIDDALNNTTIIHYTEGNFQRPWVKGCIHPKKCDWIRYRNKTVWKTLPLKKDVRSFKLKILATMI